MPGRVHAAEAIKNLPVEELKLMRETELQQELVSTCRAFVESKTAQNPSVMATASAYSQRITLVARAQNGNALPAWVNPLLMAMYQGDFAGCTMPVK